MIKQTLLFSSAVSLTLKYNQLVIHFDDSEDVVTRPIEDIGVLIIENQMVRMTVPLLNALTNNNVAVIFCDDKFMPSSMLMPLESNNVQHETQKFQIEASLPTKKRLWKEIIECKIRNQAALLDIIGYNGSLLRPYWSNVLSGDSDNREGSAARIYWKQMYGQSFIRDRNGEEPNSLLNYGYTILRAAMARALLGSGLFLGFGLFHRSRYNAFPLADDIMEPYRPFVDYVVYQIYSKSANACIDKDTKQELLRILVCDVRMKDQVRPLEVALSMTSASLVRALKDKKESVLYPSFA